MINPLSLVLLLTGVIFVITGAIMIKFPPKKINSFYGYRTPNSMKDQESWTFAQIYSGKEMIRLGIFLTLFSAIGVWYNPGNGISTILALSIFVAAILILFIRVERAIKRNRQVNH